MKINLLINRKILIILGLTLIYLFFNQSIVTAISLTVTGDWTDWVDEADLEAGPGSNLISTYTSASNQSVMSISSSTGSWTIKVMRV